MPILMPYNFKLALNLPCLLLSAIAAHSLFKVGQKPPTFILNSSLAESPRVEGLQVHYKIVLLLFIGLLLGSININAATCTSTASGSWTNSNTWDCLSVPGSLDTVIITNGFIVSLSSSDNVSANTIYVTSTGAKTATLAINSGTLNVASIYITGSNAKVSKMTISTGNVIVSGSISFFGTAANAQFTSAGASTVNVAGSFGSGGTLTTGGTGVINFNGSSAQTIGAYSTYNNVIINNSSGGVALAGAVTVGGTLTLSSATLSVGSNTLTLNGPTIAGTPANLKTIASSSLSFGGSSTGIIVPSSVSALTNLTVNNSNGVTLGSSLVLSSTLTLTSGKITTGVYSIKTSASCPASISRTSGYVNGSLQLSFPAAARTCTFHIGSSSIYAPIAITMPAGSSGGTLTGSTTGNEYALVASSAIEETQDVNRYWSLWSAGDTLVTPSYIPTFTFDAGDVDASASPTSFFVGQYVNNIWTLLTPSSALATSTTVTVTGGITATTNYIAGNAAFSCGVPSGSPSGTTCVCDNFNRTILNPSTIGNGNWNVGTSGINSFIPQIVSGRLRITDITGSESTVVTVPGTFPAQGNWVSVEFKRYAYSGSGADGMALTLSDATIAPVPGAFGGSLGYAQKVGSDCTTVGGCPGFTGGWIGIGLDEFGNFSNPSEGRQAGPGARANAVAVRGSGSGITGYPYLAGTAAGAITGSGYAYRLVVDARNYTALNKTTTVTVEQDTTGTGNNYSSLLSLPNVYTVNSSQAVVPTNWKMSFTGSTGGSTNIHELTGIRICAQSYVPASGYLIEIDNYTPTTCASNPKPIVTVGALASNGNIASGYVNQVTLSAQTLSGGIYSTSNATWTKISGGGTLSATSGGQATYQYVVGDNSVAQFSLADTTAETVYITVKDNSGAISTSSAVTFSASATAFNVTNSDGLATGPDTTSGGVVAGHPHLFTVTKQGATCGAGTDTTYSGLKALDGWYNPAAQDNPGGATAPQICAPVSGSCLPSYLASSCQTLSIAAPVVSASSNALSNQLTFANGVAQFCLVTADVGKYTLNLRDDSVATPVTGSSSTLTARPFAVVVSDVVVGSTYNPANNSSSASVFTKAGAPFSATVGGYLWNSSADGNNNGLPDNTATISQITGSGIAPYYADTVALSVTSPYTPSLGTQGILANNSVTISGGSATTATLQYSEVGSFTLAAALTSNYLNSGVNLGARAAIYANSSLSPGSSLSPLANAVVGRFIPDHFVISSSSASPSCNTFSYFGQDGFTTSFTLSAFNSSGSQTNNYIGSWAHLPLTAWGAAASSGSPGYGFAATSWSPPQPSGASLVASATNPTGTWSNGSATIMATHQISRPTSPTAPTSVNLTALPVDSDGVTLPSGAANIATAMPLDYGRIAMQNASGSELLDLAMPMTAQYWNGTAWVTNTADQCTSETSLAATQVTGPISSICAYDTGSPGDSELGCATAGTSTNQFSNPPVLGDFNLNLKAPGSGNTGTMRITATVPGYLQYNWAGTGNAGPTANATFGIYTGNKNFIYLRELY